MEPTTTPGASSDRPAPSARAALSLLSLRLHNIGPFDDATLTFLPEDLSAPTPVAIITGENGSGKSIVLDAIRGLFGREFATLERSIVRPGVSFEAELSLMLGGKPVVTRATRTVDRNNLVPSHATLASVPGVASQENGRTPSWVVDFWRSSLAVDRYEIPSLAPPNHRQFLSQALQGTYNNTEVTHLLCHFDYLRDSRIPRERLAGEALFAAASRIVQLGLLDGELVEIQRSTFTPMVRQAGQTVPLSNLSSGNAYVIQRMIGLLGKMYAVNTLLDQDPGDVCRVPGVLLLDEAENHLHPRWQKRFLPDVLSVFPNLQIIATTHSPFVVSSVPGARIFVCRYDAEQKSARVERVTEELTGLPMDDILMSEAFGETEAFGPEITELLKQRQDAMARGDDFVRAQVEAKLVGRNPRYFSYLQLDERLRSLREAG